MYTLSFLITFCCHHEPVFACYSATAEDVGLLCLWTAGCRDVVLGRILKKIFETPYFRCVVVPDADTVEICGALKVICSSDVNSAVKWIRLYGVENEEKVQWVGEFGLTSFLTHNRSFWGRFLQATYPNQQCQTKTVCGISLIKIGSEKVKGRK